MTFDYILNPCFLNIARRLFLRNLYYKMNKIIKLSASKILNKTGFVKCFLKINKSVLFLMYHRINDDLNCLGLSVTPEIFRKQIKYIKKNYKIVGMDRAIEVLSSKNTDNNYCVITFDDGYRDNYDNAFPILKRYQVPATIFVTYDAVESGRFNWVEFDEAVLKTKATHLDLLQWGIGNFELNGQCEREKILVILHGEIKKLENSKKKSVVEYVVTNYSDVGAAERVMLSCLKLRVWSRAAS